MKNIEEQIFENIKSGKVKMRPRWHFILRTTLAIVAGAVLFFTLLFLVIFIIFIQHQTGAGSAVSFGLAGWYFFFRSLPWALILTAVVLIILLAILAQRYAFFYQRPLIYALIGIVILVVALSLAISSTPLSPLIFGPGGNLQGPFINGIYQYETGQPTSIHEGQITLIANNGFLLWSAANDTSTVLFALGTSLRAQDFRIGDRVVVFGPRGQNGVIEAVGVQKL